jgi:multidrug transporter EmrE-like cation transporter
LLGVYPPASGSTAAPGAAVTLARRMPFSVQLGLLFALATAFTSILGFLYKYRGAVDAPPVQWSRPLGSSIALFRSPWYTIGILVAMGSWGLHVAALSLAPISLVQSVIAGGLVLLTVVADRLFHLPVTRREWIGVALTAAGLAFLAATLGSTGDEAHAGHSAGMLALYVGGGTLAGTVALVFGRDGDRRGIPLALSAGLLWGASDVSIKALSDFTDRGIGVLWHPLALVILALSLYGLLVSARSLQVGEAVTVIAVTSAAANVVTIAAGPIVFGEPLPDDTLGVVVRMLAFALVIAAVALTPPPLRAAEDLPVR